MKAIKGGLSAVKNVQTAGVHAGFKYKNKDLALIYFPTGATVAGVFTKNLIQAHPVIYDKALLEENKQFKAIVINSGNANVSNGSQGDEDVQNMAEMTAEKLGIEPQEVLVSSTGVIGESMDLSPLDKGLDKAISQLNDHDSTGAAQAIKTTDTTTKQVAYEVDINDKTVHIGGIIKGSGMIHPNMGTMLGYITTDLALPQPLLKNILLQATDQSFNKMTVDGDTSTNDTVLLATTGEIELELTDPVILEFSKAIQKVCQDLAKMVVDDGEGKTKFIEVNVDAAVQEEDATKIAKEVAVSNLVKTAIYGGDANWGRVMMAIGNSQPSALDPYKISIAFTSAAGQVLVCQEGQTTSFDEAKASKILAEEDIQINIDLGIGEAQSSVWTCDMSLDYIKINASYRS